MPSFQQMTSYANYVKNRIHKSTTVGGHWLWTVFTRRDSLYVTHSAFGSLRIRISWFSTLEMYHCHDIVILCKQCYVRVSPFYKLIAVCFLTVRLSTGSIRYRRIDAASLLCVDLIFFWDDDAISLAPVICGVLASTRIKDNTFSDVRIKS